MKSTTKPKNWHQNLQQRRLQFEIFIHQRGVLVAFNVLVWGLVAAVLLLFYRPLASQSHELQSRIEKLATPDDLSATGESQSPQAERRRNWLAFEHATASPLEPDSWNQQVLAQAHSSGLQVLRSEMRSVADVQPGWKQVGLLLSVRGSYAQTRNFALTALHRWPNASIDQLVLRPLANESTTSEQGLLDGELLINVWQSQVLGRATGRVE